MSERILTVETEKSEALKKVVEAFCAFYGGKAEFKPMMLIKTDSDQVADTLRLVLKDEISEVLPVKAVPQLPTGVKRGRPPLPGRPRKKDPSQPSPFLGNGEGRLAAGEFGFRFCRNDFVKFAPKHMGSLFCSPGCNNRYHARRNYMLAKKCKDIDEMFAYRTNHKVLYFTEEEFRAKLKDGGFEEGEQILSPKGYLLVVRMQGGMWVVDEVRATLTPTPATNCRSAENAPSPIGNGEDSDGG